MNKFKYLLKYQLKKRIFSKAFLISNIIILIALILVANISNIIRLFEPDQKGQKVLVVNETTNPNAVSDLETLYEGTFKNGSVMHGGLYFEVIDNFNEEDKLPTLILTTEEGKLKGILHQFKLTETNTQVLGMTVGSLASRYFLESKTEEEKALITDYGTISRNAIVVHRVDDDSAVREAMGVLAMFFSIPIYILLMMAVQFVGGSIVEEKSSKAIEYIIANVSPQQHFFAKIFTSLIALVVQTILIVIYGIIASLVSVLIFNQGASGIGGSASEMLTGSLGLDKEIVDSLLKYLPLTIVYLILFSGLGGLMMMVLMAFVAAISTTNEEYQQFQSPMMIVMLIGFYGAMFGPMFGHGNLFVRIMAYIPFFSPLMVPSLYLSGSITWWDGLISLVLLLITTIVVYRLIMPMYKQAILSYDTGEKMGKRIKKAFKAKDA